MQANHTWRTAAILQETKDTITIVFDTGGAPFAYKAGQFINLSVDIDGSTITRSYSFSSAPLAGTSPAITIKRVAGGIMSNYLHDHAAYVKEWRVNGPHGAFTLDQPCDELVLLGGGSGITPLFSLANEVLQQSPGTNVTLIYSSHNEENIIFRNALHALQQQHPQLKVHYMLSENGGRINRIIAKKLIKAIPAERAQYFICGPSGLMKLHLEVLQALNIPAQQITTEWFQPEPLTVTPTLPDSAQEVLLHFYEQSNLLEVKPGQTIMAAALEDKIALPYSCKAGTCGICAAKLLSGNVHMAQQYALGKEALEAGMVLLCQSHPLDSNVTIEII
ncbi:2Fe-2S iron-sulfur cluster-binding protein [Chitinophaga vietnamensis]|uniref:2Fe-2S iron-sulfur cluster-binding protein n=1 Tax=Chitinophaga vietnamensis TaxID=2593957 RepID=UPI001177F5C7|nr:2Fe-2S iron-sulfur cluster-binding protein [Chitinophaga vietnamensis]